VAVASPSSASACTPADDETVSALATPWLSTPRPVIAPLAVDRYKITFTATEATHLKLRQARELLRHQVPDGDLAQVVDRALEALLEQLMRRKFAALNPSHRTGVPVAPAAPVAPALPGVPGVPTVLSEPSAIPPPADRHIPADVRRAVWLRDGGSCAFVAGDGRRCGERGFVEFHHLRPFAVGGAPTAANMALRCRAHNGYEAELYFGPSRRFATAQPP
jgi:hypothetical protein